MGQHHRRSLIAVLAFGLLVAACGSGDDDEAATTTSSSSSSTTTTTQATTTTTTDSDGPVDASASPLPDTPLTAPLDETYGAAGGAFDAATFAIAEGSITAAWYLTDGAWVVHYDGLVPRAASDHCPGVSLETETGFEHVANSPYGALACAEFDTKVPPGSLKLCGDTTILHTTEIPTTAEGELRASIEQGTDAGIQGITSRVEADPTDVPEIDVSSCQNIS